MRFGAATIKVAASVVFEESYLKIGRNIIIGIDFFIYMCYNGRHTAMSGRGVLQGEGWLGTL